MSTHATVTIFNLTDIETPALKQRKLTEMTIAVGRSLLSPGTSTTVSEEDFRRALPGLQQLVTAGALAVNQAPPAYIAAKARAGGH